LNTAGVIRLWMRARFTKCSVAENHSTTTGQADHGL